MASSNGYVSTNDFLTGILGEEKDLEIDGVGKVRIRGLDSLEVQRMNQETEGDEIQLSFEAILRGLVHPELSRDDLEALSHGKPGIITFLAHEIIVISGLDEDFEKKVGIGS